MSHSQRVYFWCWPVARRSNPSKRAPRRTPCLFEGARLHTGEGSAPIEASAFLVENQKITRVGKRGEMQEPAGAVHVDLTGKTVMPVMVDLHGHIGYQNIPAGTMSKETFTRENLIDHLERLAYHGIGAVVDVASPDKNPHDERRTQDSG